MERIIRMNFSKELVQKAIQYYLSRVVYKEEVIVIEVEQLNLPSNDFNITIILPDDVEISKITGNPKGT